MLLQSGSTASSGTTNIEHLPAEIQLLVLCARTSLTEEAEGKIKALALRQIDWGCLVEKAHDNAVVPLLYKNLAAVCPDDVPASALACLADSATTTAWRSLHLAGEMIRLLDLFHTGGVNAIPYKGPLLSILSYEDLGLRTFTDIDFLIRKEELIQTHRLLEQEGYRSAILGGQGVLGKRIPAKLALLTWEEHFVKQNSSSIVDIHWDLLPTYFACGLNLEVWRQDLVSVKLSGRKIPTLSLENLILFLCIHGCKHRWERLQWLCDLAETIRRYPATRWDSVFRQAEQAGALRMVELSLVLSADLLEAPLPDDLYSKLCKSQIVSRLAQQTTDALPLAGRGGASRMNLFLYQIKLRERLSDRLRHLIRLAFSPSVSDWCFLPLPSYLWALYSLIRPLRLSWKWLRPQAGDRYT